ncbi:MAG: hypothetical protein AAB354_13040 [candidate division KSB1 bacterium]
MAANSPSMASLELLMWRPTPVRPDLVGTTTGTESSAGYTSVENFKTMFQIATDKDLDSREVRSPGNDGSAVEGSLSQRKAVTAPQATPRTIVLKHKITTSTLTEAALSAQLVMWRPTPVRPDFTNAVEPLESYNANFALGEASAGCDIQLEKCPKSNCTFSARLVQIAYSATARILELTITITMP